MSPGTDAGCYDPALVLMIDSRSSTHQAILPTPKFTILGAFFKILGRDWFKRLIHLTN